MSAPLTVLIIILCLAGLFCLLLCLRFKLWVIWCNGFLIKIALGVFSLEIPFDTIEAKLPETRKLLKERKEKRKSKRAAKREALEKSGAHVEPVTYTLKEQLSVIKTLLVMLYQRLGKKLRLENYTVKVSVGTEDPAETALLYGSISGMLASLLKVAEGIPNRKKGGKIYSECKPDFISEETDVLVDIGVSATLWRIIVAVIPIYKVWTENEEMLDELL